MRVAYLDCFSGISGDMMLGALLDLGAPLERIQQGVASLGLGDLVIRAEVVKKCGFRAVKVHIDHPPQHAHRHLHQIEAMIDAAEAVSARARELAKRIFGQLGQAEAKVHGTTIQKVHFHEVGAIDSIADIVGTAIGLDQLGIERLEASAVPAGCGSVQIAHGLVSIPAPATAELLRGIPIRPCEIERELTTPTGAAILQSLVERFGPLGAMRPELVGYGAGSFDLPGQANVLRILVGQLACETEQAPSMPCEFDRVSVIESDIDDSTPEELAACIDRLFGAGALDVTQTPCSMKKNRLGTRLTVIALPAQATLLEEMLLRHTSTIGVRRYQADRRKLIRQPVDLQTDHGPLQGKIVDLGPHGWRLAVEHDDAVRAAAQWQVSLAEVRSAAARAWQLAQGKRSGGSGDAT